MTLICAPSSVLLCIGVIEMIHNNHSVYNTDLENPGEYDVHHRHSTDHIVIALILACMAQVLYDNHLSILSWVLAGPPMVGTILFSFYYVIQHINQ